MICPDDLEELWSGQAVYGAEGSERDTVYDGNTRKSVGMTSLMHFLYCSTYFSDLHHYSLRYNHESSGHASQKSASNIICRVVFGMHYDHDVNFIRVFIQCFKENSKIAEAPWAMVSCIRFV